MDFAVDSIAVTQLGSHVNSGAPLTSVSSGPRWVFEESRAHDPPPGFHLLQHCQCYCSERGVGRVPVAISAMQFSVRMGL